MLLIGGGGNGNGTTGGGSSAVTVWYGSANNVPDSLIVAVGVGNASNSSVRGRFANSAITGTLLLNATPGGLSGGGAAMTANQFAASGFFQSVAGQNGTNSNTLPSATTFTSGGAVNGGSSSGNYGYFVGTVNNEAGFFMTQPIIVGVGGIGTARGGIGCGGGATSGAGGPGMVLIASW